MRAKQLHPLNASAMVRLVEGSDGDLAIRWPGERESVNGVSLGGEAQILGGVDSVGFLERPGLGLGRAFARDAIRTGLVDALAVDAQPGANAVGDLFLLVV